jgi:hypothetical protein
MEGKKFKGKRKEKVEYKERKKTNGYVAAFDNYNNDDR